MNNTRSYTVLTMAMLLAAAFFMQAFFGSKNMSLTWDEPSYIASGYTYITSYDYKFNPSHPPLMRSLEALPLLFMDIKAAQPNQAELTALNPQAEFGYRFIYGNGNDPRKIAEWCRLPAMIIGTLLVLALFFRGRELYGDGPALLGAALAAFCPNLLAQSKVAIEDIGCAAFVFISVWLYSKSLDKPTAKHICLCGIVTGLALLAKYTSLLLAPVYVILTFVKHHEGDGKHSLKGLFRQNVMIAGIALFVVSLAYGCNPLNYFQGLSYIYTDLNYAPTWYFFGEASEKARWYYYLVALVVKTPVPALLFIGLAAAASIKDQQDRRQMLVILVPAAVIIGVSCFDKGNFGLRRILPALPFLYLFAARAASVDSKISRVLSPLLLLWLIAEAVYIYPYHTSYFNTVAGGPKRAPYLLVADDCDIGQDLPALAAWQKNHPEAGAIRLVYNGTADPAAYGVAATRVSFAEIDNPAPGTYAISVTALVGTPWLQYAKPVARAGYSIYIYQF